MIKKSWALPSVLAAALMASGPVHAQAGAGTAHPILQGLEAAWLRQPEQQSAAARREASDATLRAAQRWSANAPSLEITAKTDRVGRNEGAREYDASVAVPLWLPGERANAQTAAQAELGALEARLGAVRWKLVERVRTAYWDQARAAIELQLAQARLANARQLHSDVSRRLQAGDLARSDGHQAEGAVAAAEAVLAQAQAAASRASRHWQTLTGRDVIQGSDLLPEAQPADGRVQAIHPELVDLATRVEVARRQQGLAQTQKYANPELTVGAVRERGAFGEGYGRSLVVGVRIPLGASSGSQARIATAVAEQQEAETALALETQRIDAEAAAARDEAQALQTARDAAERRAQLARESRGFFEKSFRLGESDLPTRLRIDLEAFEAERQAARARIELFAAISKLRQALGLLPE